MTISSALYSSATDQWPTPPAFFARLNRRYQFTLDPCASAENAKFALYFTKEQDGLKTGLGTVIAFSAIRHNGREIAKWARAVSIKARVQSGSLGLTRLARPNQQSRFVTWPVSESMRRA